MSKNLSAVAFVIILILTFTLGCSIIPRLIPASVRPAEVANSLMTALRDGDYAQAVELIDNNGNKPVESEIEKLKRKIESENLQPQSWTLEEKHIQDPRPQGKNSYYIVTGKVIFKDGSRGTMQAELRARGLRKNPWLFNDFELKR